MSVPSFIQMSIKMGKGKYTSLEHQPMNFNAFDRTVLHAMMSAKSTLHLLKGKIVEEAHF